MLLQVKIICFYSVLFEMVIMDLYVSGVTISKIVSYYVVI